MNKPLRLANHDYHKMKSGEDINIVTHSPGVSQMSPSNPSLQLQVSFCVQAPFKQGGSQITEFATYKISVMTAIMG